MQYICCEILSPKVRSKRTAATTQPQLAITHVLLTPAKSDVLTYEITAYLQWRTCLRAFFDCIGYYCSSPKRTLLVDRYLLTGAVLPVSNILANECRPVRKFSVQHDASLKETQDNEAQLESRTLSGRNSIYRDLSHVSTSTWEPWVNILSHFVLREGVMLPEWRFGNRHWLTIRCELNEDSRLIRAVAELPDNDVLPFSSPRTWSSHLLLRGLRG